MPNPIGTTGDTTQCTSFGALQRDILRKLPSPQGVIPDHKLAAWGRAVMQLGNPTARDYYLVLILTGVRRNEAPRLLWSEIDLEGKCLHVRSEIAKNGIEYRLPLSDFLHELFSRRFAEKTDSDFVFPGYRKKGRYYGCYHVYIARRAASCLS